MKCLYVYNNLSGGNKERKYHNLIVKTLKEKYEVLDFFRVFENNFDSVDYNYYDVIVISGGDGSIALMLERLISVNYQGIIGYLPLGTANDFARKNNISCKIKKALDRIINNQKRMVNIGTISNYPLLYAAALGKVAGVSFKSKKTKKIFLKFGYVLKGLKELFSKKTYELSLEIDGIKYNYKTPLCLILDTKTLGGFKVNYKEVKAYDIIILKDKYLHGALALIKIFLFGYNKKNSKLYYYHHSSSFKIFNDEISSWCVDGEERLLKDFEVKANQNKVNLL